MGKVVVSGDIADAMKAKVIVEEILGLARVEYKLRSACRVIDMPGLIGEVPIGTKLSGHEKVPQLETADLSSISFTQVNFDLWKNVVHCVVSAESEFKTKQDLMALHVQDAAMDLARMEDKQIAEELDTLTGVAGTDWTASSNDPINDIMNVMAVVEELGYETDWILMNGRVYAALVSNVNVKELFERGALVNGVIPSIVGLNVMRSTFITNKTAVIIDSKAPCIVLGDGPVKVERYGGRGSFSDGYAIAKWIEPKVVLSDAGRKLTGVLP